MQQQRVNNVNNTTQAAGLSAAAAAAGSNDVAQTTSSTTNIYDVIDTTLEIGRNVPFFLFLVLAYLYDQVNGINVLLISIPIALILFLFSSNCWLEIKSRYIVQNKPYLNTKSINRLLENPLESDVEKYTLFRLVDSVLGINLAVLIALADSLNAIAMHCLVLKWLLETVLFGGQHLLLFDDESAQQCQANTWSLINQTSSFNNNTSTIQPNYTTTTTTTRSSSNEELLVVGGLTIFLELLTSLVYFVAIKLISLYCCPSTSTDRTRLPHLDTDDARLLKSTLKVVAYVLFYVLLAVLVAYFLALLSSQETAGQECRPQQPLLVEIHSTIYQSNLFGAAVVMTSFYATLIENVTRIRNKKKKKKPASSSSSSTYSSTSSTNSRPLCCCLGLAARTCAELKKYRNVVVKSTSMCVCGAVFILLFVSFGGDRISTTTAYECCITLLEALFLTTRRNSSALQAVPLAGGGMLVRVLKNIVVSLVCFLVVSASHRRVDASLANMADLVNKVFRDDATNPARLANTGETLSMISRDDTPASLSNSRTEIIHQADRANCWHRRGFRRTTTTTRLLDRVDLSDITLALHALLACTQLLILDQPVTVQLWTLSYLVLNLLVISAVLLINYYPYQVLVTDPNDPLSSSSDHHSLGGFLIQRPATARRRPHTIRRPRLILKQPPAAADLVDQDASMIDSAFVEHKHQLRSQALADPSLSFGVDQPSMHSAYRAIIAYSLFLSATLLLVLTLRLVAHSIWLGVVLATVLGSIAISSVYWGVMRNARETIYRKSLFYTTFAFPYAQLALALLLLYALVSWFDLTPLLVFALQWLVLAALVVFANRLVVYSSRRDEATSVQMRAEVLESAVGEPLEMSVFTIDAFKEDEAATAAAADGGHDDPDGNEVKLGGENHRGLAVVVVDEDHEASVSFLGTAENDHDSDEIASTTRGRRDGGGGLKKIGSETSNINLLV